MQRVLCHYNLWQRIDRALEMTSNAKMNTRKHVTSNVGQCMCAL